MKMFAAALIAFMLPAVTNAQQPAKMPVKRAGLFHRSCRPPAPAPNITITTPPAQGTDPALLAAIMAPRSAPMTCPDYSGQLNAILANQATIIGMIGQRVPVPAPLPPVGAPAPNIYYYLGNPRLDPGTPGMPRLDPGTPGLPRLDPGTPGLPRLDPGTPSVPRLDPGTPGLPRLDPGVIMIPQPPVIIQPSPPVIVPPGRSTPLPLMPPAADQPGMPKFGDTPPMVWIYETKTRQWVKGRVASSTQWRKPAGK